MHLPRCSTTVLVLWVASAIAHATAPAKTPADLIRSLIAAAQQGDTDTFLSGLTASSRKAVTDSFARQASVQQAQQAFEQALDARFGKAAPILPLPTEDLKVTLSRLAGAEILQSKPGPAGSMLLRVKTSIKGPSGTITTREDSLIVRQEGGGWKLVLGSPAEKQPGAKSILETFTKKVQNGEFKDRVSAMVALDSALLGTVGKKKEVSK